MQIFIHITSFNYRYLYSVQVYTPYSLHVSMLDLHILIFTFKLTTCEMLTVTNFKFQLQMVSLIVATSVTDRRVNGYIRDEVEYAGETPNQLATYHQNVIISPIGGSYESRLKANNGRKLYAA